MLVVPAGSVGGVVNVSVFPMGGKEARGQCDKKEAIDSLGFILRQLLALGGPAVPDSLLCGSCSIVSSS